NEKKDNMKRDAHKHRGTNYLIIHEGEIVKIIANENDKDQTTWEAISLETYLKLQVRDSLTGQKAEKCNRVYSHATANLPELL
ncbi:hypothetical protein PENTCL1PPCAC_10218, partial [Pristionchus entomophagus]